MACKGIICIDVCAAASDGQPREFELTDSYFRGLDQESMSGGHLHVVARVKEDHHQVFHVTYAVAGQVTVACDRCLEDLSLDVNLEEEVLVSQFVDGGDDREEVYCLEVGETLFDLGWEIYEAVELSLPLKRVHPDGGCDPDMVERLSGVVDGDIEIESDGNLGA